MNTPAPRSLRSRSATSKQYQRLPSSNLCFHAYSDKTNNTNFRKAGHSLRQWVITFKKSATKPTWQSFVHSVSLSFYFFVFFFFLFFYSNRKIRESTALIVSHPFQWRVYTRLKRLEKQNARTRAVGCIKCVQINEQKHWNRKCELDETPSKNSSLNETYWPIDSPTAPPFLR